MLKRIRFQLAILRGITLKHKAYIVLGSLFGIIFSLSLPKLLSWVSLLRVEHHKIGIIGQFQQTTLPLEITSKISLGLTQTSPDGTAIPAIAQKWEQQDGGKTFVFTIDPSAKWQDGSKITASDVHYLFKDVETNVRGDQIIEYKLKDIYTPFPSTVSRPIFKDRLIGNGPYKIDKIAYNGQTVLSVKLKALGNNLPNITYKFYPTEDTALTAFKLGEVSSVEDLSSPNIIATWPGTRLAGTPRFDRFVAAFFNTQKDPFTDKSVRQALAYSIDKNIYPHRAISPLSPLSWAFNNQVKLYDKDIPKAKSLLERASIKNLEIEISTFSWLIKDAEYIKRSWEEIGIKSRIKIVNTIPEDFDVLLAAQKIPFDPDQYSIWHSTQVANITRFKNPKIDKLLEDGRKTSDKNARLKLYIDFQRFLIEESPAVFLFHPIFYTLSR